ncbi:MAG: glycosyltransferase, partial [Cyanobacteria bacterium J06636_28]
FEPALAVLENQDLSDVVSVTGPIPYKDALQKLQRANLLFMPLPDRMDGTPGERISLKTYEYLMTDRPILAAVPPGENRNYLSDKPGVYLVNPFDVEAMAQVIEQLAIKHMAGETLIVDRVETQRKISYYRRGDELATLVLDVLDRADNGKSCSGALVMESTTISSQR